MFRSGDILHDLRLDVHGASHVAGMVALFTKSLLLKIGCSKNQSKACVLYWEWVTFTNWFFLPFYR